MNGLRYYGKIFAGTLRSMKPWQVCVAVAVWAVTFITPFRFSWTRVAAGIVCGSIFLLVFVAVGALVLTLKNYKLHSALDRLGYGVEYLREFEKERIVNKPFRLQTAVDYAAIFSSIGQPADAVKYLDSITVPANAQDQEKIYFFFVYVTSAIKMGDLALAENKWREFQYVIDNARRSPLYSTNSYMLYLALIYIDCFAGKMNNDPARIQRAYDQTVNYMNTEHYKRYPLPTPDFEIVMLLELKYLGRTEEFNALYTRVRHKIDAWDPLLRVQKQIVYEDLEKVCRGELPL